MYVDIDNLFGQMPAFEEQAVLYTPALTESITEAESIIDSKLGTRYSTPFADYSATPPNPCPKIITTISSILSRSISLSGSYLADQANAEPRAAKMLWDRAMYLMDEIIDGKMKIVSSDPLIDFAAKNRGVYSNTLGKKPTLKNFDLESPFNPSLHDQMRGADQLTAVPDENLI